MEHPFQRTTHAAEEPCSAKQALNPLSVARCLVLAVMNINIEELLQKLEIDDSAGLVLAEAETVSATDGRRFSNIFLNFQFIFSHSPRKLDALLGRVKGLVGFNVLLIVLEYVRSVVKGSVVPRSPASTAYSQHLWARVTHGFWRKVEDSSTSMSSRHHLPRTNLLL